MTHTYGTNYKRGAFVGGFEYHQNVDVTGYTASQIHRDMSIAQFVADSWERLPSPLHKFYVTNLDIGSYTISVHVETLAEAVALFQKYDHLTLHPLNSKVEA